MSTYDTSKVIKSGAMIGAAAKASLPTAVTVALVPSLPVVVPTLLACAVGYAAGRAVSWLFD